MRRVLYLVLPLALALLAFPLSAPADHGNADEASPNMLHVANLPPAAEHVACNRFIAPAPPFCFNSDLAFWEAGALRGRPHILAQGNYEGIRLVDVSDPSNPRQLSSLECRGNQGDVSFYQAENRLLLIQSIEEPVDDDNCPESDENPPVLGTNPVTNVPALFRQKGHEGLRIFDVTKPTAPRHIATVRTACGSHTHTTIRDERNQRAIIYVSSYPSGQRVTRREDLATLPQQPNCIPDHNKISIVEIPDKAPETAHVLKEQQLDQDTVTWNVTGNGGSPVRGCHDITALYESQAVPQGRNGLRVAGAACLSEGQLWDISDPANPTTNVPGRHTHIRNPFVTTSPLPPFTGLWHTASFSWDGRIVLFTDEWQGGGAHGCDGPQDTRGNVWFYRNVEPGAPAPLFGRFILPRPQPLTEGCTMHNGNVIPTNDGYFGVSSAYQGGTSVFDFTGVEEFPEIFLPPAFPAPTPPLVGREVAFYDAKADSRGIDDAWSTYWHNDYVYASSGLPQSLARPGNRGLDVYLLLGQRGRLVDETGAPAVTAGETERTPGVQQYRARKFRYQNPQTQDTFQALGHGPK
jgi:hypothetical protein